MEDFEKKCRDHVEEIEETHRCQLLSLQRSVTESFEAKPKKWSRDLLQYRKRQLLMADQRRYHEAQRTKLAGDALEKKEREDMNASLEVSLRKRERNLRMQQLAEVEVLTKRIASKRREYAAQRDTDCAKLLQRNKNIQATIDAKHVSTFQYEPLVNFFLHQMRVFY